MRSRAAEWLTAARFSHNYIRPCHPLADVVSRYRYRLLNAALSRRLDVSKDNHPPLLLVRRSYPSENLNSMPRRIRTLRVNSAGRLSGTLTKSA